MPSRKFHGKSRHGCKTCKGRKVRCDLARPACDNCTRLSRECVYADDLTSGNTIVQRGSPPHQSGRASSAGVAPLSSLASLPVLELELMHQYMAKTVFSTTDNLAHHLPIWQHVVPRLAFRHHFLLHGILASSALHLHLERSGPLRSELLDVARYHQQEGLKTYIPLLNSINADNCQPLFAFSSIIAAVSFGFLSISEKDAPPLEFVRGVIGMFKLLKGAAAIAVEAQDWLRAGELAPMLGHGPAMLDWNFAPISGEPKQALQALLESVNRMSPQRLTPESLAPGMETTTECYASSIEKLKPLFPRAPEKVPKIATVIGWPVFINQAYLNMLSRQDDAALVILAYYGVTLHKLDHIWWLKDVGWRLVQSVSEVVSKEWAPYLAWPNSEVSRDV